MAKEKTEYEFMAEELRRTDEVLRSNDLLEKVQSWKHPSKCPICEKDFQDGDLLVFASCSDNPYRPISIHARCCPDLKRRKKE
jgi:hypothetical protein